MIEDSNYRLFSRLHILKRYILKIESSNIHILLKSGTKNVYIYIYSFFSTIKMVGIEPFNIKGVDYHESKRTLA